MKRDMEIVRSIVLATAELQPGQSLQQLPDVDDSVFAFHVAVMQEAGLVKALIHEYMTDEPDAAFVLRLTWEGCEFADAVRDDTLWKKAKDNVIKPSASFSYGLLKDWLKSELQKGFPTLRG